MTAKYELIRPPMPRRVEPARDRGGLKPARGLAWATCRTPYTYCRDGPGERRRRAPSRSFELPQA